MTANGGGNGNGAPSATTHAEPFPGTRPDQAVLVRGARRIEPGPRLWAAVGQVMTVVGVVAVLFVIYLVWVSGLTQLRSQRLMFPELKETLLSGARGNVSTTDPSESGVLGGEEDENPDAVPEDQRAPEPTSVGAPVAALSIPAIDLRQVVVEGTGSAELRHGPGHFRSSALPGQVGNAVIGGHRTAFGAPFRHLDELKPGDIIETTSIAGESRYRVEKVGKVEEGERDPTAPTPTEDKLTLITSAPLYLASDRLVVEAQLEGEPTSSASTPPPAVDDSESGFASEPHVWAQVFFWGQLLVLVFLATRMLYRRWERWPTYLICTPILLALLLLFFESLSGALPGTL